MRKLSIFILLLPYILLNCTNSSKSTDKEKIDSTATPAAAIDSLTIDLVALKNKGSLKNTQQITIINDPVYHKSKKFNALPLKELFENYSSEKNLNPAETKVVFECEDGYKPEMPLAKLLAAKTFLAVSDVDAPAGKEWEPIIKDGHPMKAEPFYIVYEGVSPEDADYKWPYNLVKIHFAPATENEAFIKPTDSSVLKGYALFKKHCQTCHSINKVGGKMGPELNFPKSVTEYWQTNELKAFIKNPASYRNDVKMPTLGLPATDIEEIVKYLTVMSKQKINK